MASQVVARPFLCWRCNPSSRHCQQIRLRDGRVARGARCFDSLRMSRELQRRDLGELVGRATQSRLRAAFCRRPASTIGNRIYGHRPTRSWPSRRGRVRCCLRWGQLRSCAFIAFDPLTMVPVGGGGPASRRSVADWYGVAVSFAIEWMTNGRSTVGEATLQNLQVGRAQRLPSNTPREIFQT